MAGRLLSSPRFRRRLLKIGLVLVALGVATTVSIVFWDTGHKIDSPLRDEPATVLPQPKNVRLTEADRAAAVRAAARFVDTAVKREHIADSYALVTPSLRQGMTKAEWAKGNIPVQYFPVDAARWKLDYTYPDEVGLQVYLVPRRGEHLRPAVFYLSVKALGRSDRRRWLVDSFVPRSYGEGVPSAPSSSSAALGAARSGNGTALGEAPPKPALGTAWLAVPLLLVLGVLLVPATLLIRSHRRARRAERDYLASLE